MTDYVVMFPADNEAEWEAGTEADRQATFDTDFEFGQLLEARGGAVTGGAGLTHSSQARTIRRGPKSNVAGHRRPVRGVRRAAVRLLHRHLRRLRRARGGRAGPRPGSPRRGDPPGQGVLTARSTASGSGHLRCVVTTAPPRIRPVSMDPAVSNPESYEVIFENDRVRVLEYRDQPGHRTTPHAHPDSVMYTLSSFRRRLIAGDQEREVELAAGQAMWLSAQQHAGHNIGDTETHVLFVELKP